MLSAAGVFLMELLRFVLLIFIPAESLMTCILHFSALLLRTYLFELFCKTPFRLTFLKFTAVPVV